MVLIAVPTREVRRHLQVVQQIYTLEDIFPYNQFFTHSFAVRPLAEPAEVIDDIKDRLSGSADVVSCTWADDGSDYEGCLVFEITEHASTSIP